MGVRGVAWLVAVLAGPVMATAACGPSDSGTGPVGPGIIKAVGAENQYGDVLRQIGGQYIHVTSILDNPNTDPHTFESSPSVAEEVGSAQLVVQNGLGYDGFMDKIESASSGSRRRLIVVQTLLGLPDSTPNPHLWYDPKTMPAVGAAIAGDLSAIQPAHSSYFEANLETFDQSLQPWLEAIASFKARYGGTPVSTTEPVADYLLTAMGADNLTPFTFQAEIMNGTDPSPQGISQEEGFFTKHQAKVFCYNQQVVDSLTSSIRQTAEKAGVPVVGVYETMPTPGYDYQSWMLAEVQAVQNAVAKGISRQHL